MVLIYFSLPGYLTAKKKPPVSVTSGGFAVTALLQNYLFNPLSPVISSVQLIRARTTTRRCTRRGHRQNGYMLGGRSKLKHGFSVLV
jgi:hypothetical protein